MGGKETFLCLNVSPQGLPGCQLVCLCVPLAYLRHPCPSPLWNAGMVLCRGQQGTSAGEDTGDGGGGSDERGRRGRPARGKWEGAKGGERGKKARGKKAKEGGAAPEGRSGGGWEVVSSLWVSINSCLGVDLCALCFSSYCLGIPVATLPAPMLGSHHHPSRSDLLGKRKGKRTMEHSQRTFSSASADPWLWRNPIQAPLHFFLYREGSSGLRNPTQIPSGHIP